jgi:hypothetical protein
MGCAKVAFEQRAGVVHRLVQPQAVERVAQVVVGVDVLAAAAARIAVQQVLDAVGQRPPPAAVDDRLHRVAVGDEQLSAAPPGRGCPVAVDEALGKADVAALQRRAAHALQSCRRSAARGSPSPLPKWACAPSGNCTSSVPTRRLRSRRNTARAAAGAAAAGRRQGGGGGGCRVGGRVGALLAVSTGDEGLRRRGLAEEGHALEPQPQRLPVDARDHAQVISGMPKKAARALRRQRLQVRLTLVCSSGPASSSWSMRATVRVGGAHEAEAVPPFDVAEGRDVEDLARHQFAAVGQLAGRPAGSSGVRRRCC